MEEHEVIIIGCGPAGLACGITLAAHHIDCLILEKKDSLKDIVCGDGLTPRSLRLASGLGISIEDLLIAGGKKITSHVTYSDGSYYHEKLPEISVGLPRDIFDDLLLDRYLRLGGKVKFGYRARKTEERDGIYFIDDGYMTRNLVIATGKDYLQLRKDCSAKAMPVGISSRIRARAEMLYDSFYFFRSNLLPDGYGWVFPVGENLFNVGVWGRKGKEKMNQIYQMFENRIKEEFLVMEGYDRKPKGAILPCRYYAKDFISDPLAIGDAQFLIVPSSGEGVCYALASGIDKAESIMKKMCL